MHKSNRFWAVVVCFVWLSPLTAQNQSSNPSSSSKSNRQFEERVLDLVVPNTLIIEGRDTKVAPLSVGQKFGQVGKNFFNPFVFIGTGFQSGIDQAFDVHSGYGQGAEGYGKRYGANIADTATTQFFGVGVYPSIFHTDPRYYRMGSGGFFSRGWYAATRVFVTRTDSGRRIFNAPEIIAATTASGISRSYYPSDERNAGDFAYSMGSQIAFDAAYNVVKEFWPDVRKHVFGH